MGSGHPEQSDVEQEIMGATFRALCSHGYAGLSMRNIADEFDKSKSLLYYHYDTKEQLLLAFLDHVIGWMPARLEESAAEGAAERLPEFLQRFVIGPDEEQRIGFALALFELRLQGAHNDRFQEKLRAHYRENEATVATIIAEGIEEGVFREVDPEAVASWVYASVEGARLNQVVLGAEAATEHTVGNLIVQLEHHLAQPGVTLREGKQIEETQNPTA